MLSQALEDLRIYPSESPRALSRHNYLNSLLHTTSQSQRAPTTVRMDSPDMNSSSLLLTPTKQRQQQSFDSSFQIHEDYGNMGRGEGGSGESGHLMNLEGDEEFSGIYPSSSSQLHSFLNSGEVGRESFQGTSSFLAEDDDSNSVESYSRIAGRLSLDSSSG